MSVDSDDTFEDEPLSTKIKPLLRAHFRSLERCFEARNGVTGISTGLHGLDEATGGLQRGEFVLITGAPMVGKTSLCLTLARNAGIRGNYPVLFVSAKRTAHEVVADLLCSESGVETIAMWRGRLKRGDLTSMSASSELLASSDIEIAAQRSLELRDLRKLVRQFTEAEGRSGKHALVILDDLQCLASYRSQDDSWRTLPQFLKDVALECECTFVGSLRLAATADGSRANPWVDVELPSPWRYDDADLGLHLHHVGAGKEKTSSEVLEVQIFPNGHGASKVIEVGFEKRYRRVVETGWRCL